MATVEVQVKVVEVPPAVIGTTELAHTLVLTADKVTVGFGFTVIKTLPLAEQPEAYEVVNV